jgi:carbamoylphosphate synthase large subunit
MTLRRKAKGHLSDFTRPFNAMFRKYGGEGPSASALLAEELLTGQPFTVEGFVYDGNTTILGVVDAHYYRGTRSYQRFQYPSTLSAGVQRRAAGLITRLMTHLQYRHGLFNIDCLYNRQTDRIFLLEINPRMAAQIADLFEKVDGTNSYSVLLSLARGSQPKVTARQGRYRVAASFILRRFGDRYVAAINGPEAVLAKFPDARAHVYVEADTKLSDDEFQDVRSYVYAVVNIGADSEKDLWRKLRASEALLAPRFRPV